MASRNNKSSKSSGASGLRILWIPGGRKNHSKGRFDSTNKQIGYSSKQKKSEVWSLGGKKAHEDMVKSDPDTTLFDGPSVSGVTPVTCAIGAVGVAGKCTTTTIFTANNNGHFEPTTTTIENQPPPVTPNDNNLPITPNSTTSTAPLLSLPSSPVSTLSNGNGNETMPAKTTAPVVTTTTAEIIDENRFSILSKDISNEIDIYDLPRAPKDDLNGARNNLLLNTSAGTTDSTATNTTTSPSPSISPKSDTKSSNKDSTGSPKKQKAQHKNHNNNHQSDINSIESISENTKVPNADLDWIDELLLKRNSKEILTKSKKKKKKKISTTKELDQLDGVPTKQNHSEASTDEDEKVVKCLYYTLMCCECTIS